LRVEQKTIGGKPLPSTTRGDEPVRGLGQNQPDIFWNICCASHKFTTRRN